MQGASHNYWDMIEETTPTPPSQPSPQQLPTPSPPPTQPQPPPQPVTQPPAQRAPSAAASPAVRRPLPTTPVQSLSLRSFSTIQVDRAFDKPLRSFQNHNFRDKGNCTPRYMRSSIYQIPTSENVLKETGIPLAITLQPFGAPESGEVFYSFDSKLYFLSLSASCSQNIKPRRKTRSLPSLYGVYESICAIYFCRTSICLSILWSHK